MPTVRLIDADMFFGCSLENADPEALVRKARLPGPTLQGLAFKASPRGGDLKEQRRDCARRHLSGLIEARRSSVNALRLSAGRCGEHEKTNKALMRLNFSRRTVNGWSATG